MALTDGYTLLCVMICYHHLPGAETSALSGGCFNSGVRLIVVVDGLAERELFYKQTIFAQRLISNLGDGSLVAVMQTTTTNPYGYRETSPKEAIRKLGGLKPKPGTHNKSKVDRIIFRGVQQSRKRNRRDLRTAMVYLASTDTVAFDVKVRRRLRSVIDATLFISMEPTRERLENLLRFISKFVPQNQRIRLSRTDLDRKETVLTALSILCKQIDAKNFIDAPLPQSIDCTELGDGSFPDPEKACSKVFYKCGATIGHRVICPEETFYDRQLKNCLRRNQVDECRQKSPLRDQGFSCIGKADGNYEGGKCERFFWRCSDDRPFQQICPAELYYDSELDACYAKQHVPNCGGVRPLVRPSKTNRDQPRGLVSDREFNCKKRPDGVYAPDASKCTIFYYECSNRQAFRKICGRNTYYDINNRICNIRRNIPVCGGQRMPVPYKPIPKKVLLLQGK